MRVACWISKAKRAQAHARAPAHARTRAHTEMCNTFAFPRQKWLRERASMLRYTYIARLVSYGCQSLLVPDIKYTCLNKLFYKN